MGEVYRARDSRLGREVAIKVLPELFASDPERLARFEREAQLKRERQSRCFNLGCGMARTLKLGGNVT